MRVLLDTHVLIWLVEGLEQGLQREVDLVLRRLERRCGVLGVDRQELVRTLTIAQLEALGDALLDFNGMVDLEAWFKANLSPS